MKKLLISAMVIGVAAAAMFGGKASAVTYSEGYVGSNGCVITTAQPGRSVGVPMVDHGGATRFVRTTEDRAVIKVTATGKNCNETVSMASWKTPSWNGRPFNQRVLARQKTVTLTEGVKFMSIGIPPKGCFFQIDLVFGGPTGPNGGPFYEKGRLINAVLGGTTNCIPKPEPPVVTKIKVCDLTTKKVIVINKNQFDATKHTLDLTKCVTTVTPGQIKVCELATLNTIVINESDFDATKHSTDLTKCVAAPVVPGTAPASTLVKTGPASVIAIFVAITAAATVGYTLFARRANRV